MIQKSNPVDLSEGVFIIMKEIKLSQGKVALVDDEDFERVNEKAWHASKSRGLFYARSSTYVDKKCRCIHLHRYILNCENIEIEIDHIDGNGLNCQKKNLRECTHSQNMMNKKPYKNGTSLYKGVHFQKSNNKYVATIRINGKQKHLGYYTKEIDAAIEYDKNAIKYYGEFARLNISINQ